MILSVTANFPGAKLFDDAIQPTDLEWSMRGLAVLLGEGALNPWRREVLGLDGLQRIGLQVVYLDCEPLIRPTQEANSSRSQILHELENLLRLSGQHREIFVFSHYELSDRQFRPIRDFLRKQNIPWCRVFTGFVPSRSPPEGAPARITALAFLLSRFGRRSRKWGEIARAVRKKIRNFAGASSAKYAPKYVLFEGISAQKNSLHLDATPIFGHSRDYESVLAAGLMKQPRNSERYCVFLDSNEVHHEDFEILGFGRHDVVEETWYRQALQRSFKVIEESTGLRVVVVPHPRYQYPPDYFGSFEVRPGNTAQTVASSSLVIGHYSTSLGFAVIFDKPVVLLNSTPMMRLAGGFTGRYVKGFQHALGCLMLDMDQPDPASLKGWQNIDINQFAEYRANYVKYPDSPEISMWENAVRTIAHHEGWDL